MVPCVCALEHLYVWRGKGVQVYSLNKQHLGSVLSGTLRRASSCRVDHIAGMFIV